MPQLVKHQSLEATPTPIQREEGRTGSIVSRQGMWLSKESGHVTSLAPVCSALQSVATSCVDELEQLAYQRSSFAGLPSTKGYAFTEQLIRCHAVVVDSHLCIRVNTLPAYVEANRMVSVEVCPWWRTLDTLSLSVPVAASTHQGFPVGGRGHISFPTDSSKGSHWLFWSWLCGLLSPFLSQGDKFR